LGEQLTYICLRKFTNNTVSVKKLLILAYDFPPYVSVGGLRPFNWFKYLKEYGIEPVVVTRQWENKYGNHFDYISAGYARHTIMEKHPEGIILRTPYRPNLSNRLLLKYGAHKFRVLRKLISGFYELIQFLYPIGPKSEIYREARNYLKKHEVDAIIATGDPFVLFRYAAQLSKEFDIPWIADYRDPWSHNQEHQKNKLQQWWNSFHERTNVCTSSHITTVSSFVFKKIDSLIPGKEHTILPNGFDPQVIDHVIQIQQNSDYLSIGFVGTIYDWHPLESFLRTVDAFIKTNPGVKLKLNFYGTNIQEKLIDLTTNKYLSLNGQCEVTSKLPNKELLEVLVTNNVVLLFNYYSYMGTKIFDYLGIRRKMILCYSDDAEAKELKEKYYRIEEFESESGHLQADLIHETNSGIVVKDAAHLMEVFEELWEEFSATGQIACESHGVEKYSRKVQVERLAALLDTFLPTSEHSK